MQDCMRVASRIGWRSMGGEVISFNCNNQKIAIWNSTASELWEMLALGATVDEMAEMLSSKYIIDRADAHLDVLNFLSEAASMGFVCYAHLDVNNCIKDQDTGEDILLAIEMKAIEKNIPYAVTFETTYDCNVSCIHCYMDKGLESLTFAEITTILLNLAEEGCLFITFTGGEFLLRPDAIAIVEFAHDLKFVIDILSNGLLVDSSIATVLANFSIRRFQISLYGATPETHDFVTSLPGSFDKTINAIRLLRQVGIKVEIAFPLMEFNFKDCYDVIEMADSLGCLVSFSPIITARNNGAKDTHSLRITNDQLEKFLKDEKLYGTYSGRKPFQDHKLYLGFSDLLDAAPCYGGFNTCAITPSGKVLPCNQLLLEVGDLKVNSFSEVWRHSPKLQQLRKLKISNLVQCSECDILHLCARCPGLALLENDNILGISTENCRLASAMYLSHKGGN